MKLQIYQDVNGNWRWRLKAKNGRVVACAGEGYKTKRACEEGLHLVKDYFEAADL